MRVAEQRCPCQEPVHGVEHRSKGWREAPYFQESVLFVRLGDSKQGRQGLSGELCKSIGEHTMSAVPLPGRQKDGQGGEACVCVCV
jgi:hypothetical protein